MKFYCRQTSNFCAVLKQVKRFCWKTSIFVAFPQKFWLGDSKIPLLSLKCAFLVKTLIKKAHGWLIY